MYVYTRNARREREASVLEASSRKFRSYFRVFGEGSFELAVN